MKSLMLLLEALLSDEGRACSTATTADMNTIYRRVEHEGLSFVTIALPNFCVDFERGLRECLVDSTFFLGYKKNGCLPAFLQGFTSRVFNQQTGVLLNDPDIGCIRAIRQICLFAKKIQLDCSKSRTTRALSRFVQQEADQVWQRGPSGPWDLFDLIARRLWSFQDFSPYGAKFWGDCRHGPGATAERVTGNSKFSFKQWHTRLDSCFPVDYFRFVNVSHLEDSLDGLDCLNLRSPEEEQPVRVIPVPKTMKTPRIIAIEPVCMQYTQQALASLLTREIEKHPVAQGKINFVDQTLNQQAAMSASKTGSLATIDLSDASDLVHRNLAWRMLASNPKLRAAIFACRSRKANVVFPDGSSKSVKLHKFASMGSALCFPIEAMVFFTIIMTSLVQKHMLPVVHGDRRLLSRRLTTTRLRELASDVLVYGDDIIVPADEVVTVVSSLTQFGLKVNTSKTFGTGKFRESCGVDAYDGEDVTPVYLRRMLPHDRRSHPELLSSVSLANHLYLAGLWESARLVRMLVEQCVGSLPHVSATSPGLGWVSVLGTLSYHRWDIELHRPLVKTYVPHPRRKKDILSGYPALLKFFLGKPGLYRMTSEKHLMESVRSGTVYTKRRWVTPT